MPRSRVVLTALLVLAGRPSEAAQLRGYAADSGPAPPTELARQGAVRADGPVPRRFAEGSRPPLKGVIGGAEYAYMHYSLPIGGQGPGLLVASRADGLHAFDAHDPSADPHLYGSFSPRVGTLHWPNDTWAGRWEGSYHEFSSGRCIFWGFIGAVFWAVLVGMLAASVCGGLILGVFHCSHYQQQGTWYPQSPHHSSNRDRQAKKGQGTFPQSTQGDYGGVDQSSHPPAADKPLVVQQLGQGGAATQRDKIYGGGTADKPQEKEKDKGARPQDRRQASSQEKRPPGVALPMKRTQSGPAGTAARSALAGPGKAKPKNSPTAGTAGTAPRSGAPGGASPAAAVKEGESPSGRAEQSQDSGPSPKGADSPGHSDKKTSWTGVVEDCLRKHACIPFIGIVGLGVLFLFLWMLHVSGTFLLGLYVICVGLVFLCFIVHRLYDSIKTRDGETAHCKMFNDFNESRCGNESRVLNWVKHQAEERSISQQGVLWFGLLLVFALFFLFVFGVQVVSDPNPHLAMEGHAKYENVLATVGLCAGSDQVLPYKESAWTYNLAMNWLTSILQLFVFAYPPCAYVNGTLTPVLFVFDTDHTDWKNPKPQHVVPLYGWHAALHMQLASIHETGPDGTDQAVLYAVVTSGFSQGFFGVLTLGEAKVMAVRLGTRPVAGPAKTGANDHGEQHTTSWQDMPTVGNNWQLDIAPAIDEAKQRSATAVLPGARYPEGAMIYNPHDDPSRLLMITAGVQPGDMYVIQFKQTAHAPELTVRHMTREELGGGAVGPAVRMHDSTMKVVQNDASVGRFGQLVGRTWYQHNLSTGNWGLFGAAADFSDPGGVILFNLSGSRPKVVHKLIDHSTAKANRIVLLTNDKTGTGRTFGFVPLEMSATFAVFDLTDPNCPCLVGLSDPLPGFHTRSYCLELQQNQKNGKTLITVILFSSAGDMHFYDVGDPTDLPTCSC